MVTDAHTHSLYRTVSKNMCVRLCLPLAGCKQSAGVGCIKKQHNDKEQGSSKIARAEDCTHMHDEASHARLQDQASRRNPAQSMHTCNYSMPLHAAQRKQETKVLGKNSTGVVSCFCTY